MAEDFLKKADQQLKQQQQQPEAEQDKQAGWIDTEQVMEELKKAAEEIIYEKDPQLKELVQSLKKKYKDILVYFFDENEFYIYRPLTRFEYKEITGQTDNAEKAGEQLVLKQVLYPKLDSNQLDQLKAGVIPTLLELVMNASNFGIQNPVVKL